MWLGTIMWFNVWFLIWPNQQKALNIGGKYPDLAAAGKGRRRQDRRHVQPHQHDAVDPHAVLHGRGGASVLGFRARAWGSRSRGFLCCCACRASFISCRVGPDRVLVIDAISHVRLMVNGPSGARASPRFAQPRKRPPAIRSWPSCWRGASSPTRRRKRKPAMSPGCWRPIMAAIRKNCWSVTGARRAKAWNAYFAATQALTPEDFAAGKTPLELLLFGDCDVQVESDFLRREAARPRHRSQNRRQLSRRSAPGRKNTAMTPS